MTKPKKKVGVKRMPARRPAVAKAKGAKDKSAKASPAKAEAPLAEDAKAKQRQAKRMLRPAGCRSYMRRELADEFPEIVEGFVEAAKTGSVPHVKLATELLKPTRNGTTRRKGTVGELLEKLKRNEPFVPSPEALRWATAKDPGPADDGI